MGDFLWGIIFVFSEIKANILICPNECGARESRQPNVKQRVVKVIKNSKTTESIIELGKENRASENESLKKIQRN
jgi:hypothetical protein